MRLEHLGHGTAYSIFPLTNPPLDWSSGNWATYHQELTEEEEGLFAKDVDVSDYTVWLIFEGTSFPTSMADYKAVWVSPDVTNESLQTQLNSITSTLSSLTSPIVYNPTYSGTWFTSQAEMEREFSVAGVSNRTADYSGSDKTTLINEIIVQATNEAKAVLNQLFDDSDLATHPWIRRRTTLIGCYFLSIRLGNDSEYYTQYLDAIADFQDLIDGKYNLGIAVTGGCRASMINVSSDNRYPFTPMRVDTLTSTSESQGADFPKYYVPYYWM